MNLKLSEKFLSLIDTLITNDIKPVLVGGYLRDYYLKNLKSKDIDIELYNVSSIQDLISILKPFGNVYEVGRSFGVLKMSYDGYEIDFSLPRTESKISKGHRGFEVKTYRDISFKEASKRRDFTINSMGYDFKNKLLLDPYCGLDDIKDKILCCVDETTFVEDPLRLFRAIGFSGRFDFTCKQNLINLCQQMYLNGSLESLAKERVFDEIKKLLLLSNRPSTGFKLLSQMEALRYFDKLYALDKSSFSKTLDMLDTLAKRDIKDDKLKLKLMFCVLTLQMRRVEDVNNFVKSLTDEISLTKDILSLYQSYRDFLTSNLTDFKIKTIALHVKIQELYILTAVTDDTKIRLKGEEFLSRA
jgi:tRNA nucleotidyltransferase (CCA-adding enzyme)